MSDERDNFRWETPDDFNRWDFVTDKALTAWVHARHVAWVEHWKGKPHRYGDDFYAFLGESLMTDFGIDRRSLGGRTP